MHWLCEDQIKMIAFVMGGVFWRKISEELIEMTERCLEEKNAPCMDEYEECFTEEFEGCVRRAIKEFLRKENIEDAEVEHFRYLCPDSEIDIWKNAHEIVEIKF